MTATRTAVAGVMLAGAIIAAVAMMVFPEAWLPLGAVACVLLIAGAAIMPSRGGQ